MQHEEIKPVYKYDELNDKAKERAREAWRDVHLDHCWWDDVFNDAIKCASILGIEIGSRPVYLIGGGTRYIPAIYFSGFYSQGDGACFEGVYRYAKDCKKAIRQYAPNDKLLHNIADRLTAAQKPHFYRLEAVIKHTGRYCHSKSTTIDVYNCESPMRNIGDDEEEIQNSLRWFMNWIYRQLEAEYKYQMSDEGIEESIRENEVEFDETGKVAPRIYENK